MAQVSTSIQSIRQGISASPYVTGEAQYHAGIAIDPQLAIDTSATINGPSMQIRPTPVERVDTSENLNAKPIFIAGNPSHPDEVIIVGLENGKFVAFDEEMNQQTSGFPKDPSGVSSLQGMAYYNNFYYFIGNNDVEKYGPMDGSPSTSSFWSSQFATPKIEAPTVGGVVSGQNIPSQTPFFHAANNKLYFPSFRNGNGYINYIRTKKGTANGDTNDDSGQGADDQLGTLKLPGLVPVAISNWGDDIAILVWQAFGNSTRKGITNQAYMVLWDTVSQNPYRYVPLGEPYATAIVNNGGNLIVFAGTSEGATRVQRYLGNFRMETLATVEAEPPMPGAATFIGDRLYWAGRSLYPENKPCVWALNYLHPESGEGALHNVAVADGDSNEEGDRVYCIYPKPKNDFNNTQLILGSYTDNLSPRLDTTTGTSLNRAVWRSKVIFSHNNFQIDKIEFNLGADVDANTTIEVRVHADDGQNETLIGTIDNTSNSVHDGRKVRLFPSLEADSNFFLEFIWTGSSMVPINLPIQIVFTQYDA